jgi:ATP-dependent DNA helicase RecG
MENTIPVSQSLVIGDVGSGKTAVAFMVGLNYLLGLEKGQAALLAPTEVLAFQHYLNLVSWVEKLYILKKNITTIFVSAKDIRVNNQKVTKKQLSSIINESNKIFWVGTHALLFKEEINPDLVMVDEQHRFGVGQRKSLNSLDQNLASHFVSFTATPIPRTLSLTLLETLQPHFLEPIRERVIHTEVQDFSALETKVKADIESNLKKKRKIFLICPKVEEDETDLLWTVSKLFKWAEQNFPGKVAQVHGKLKDKSKLLTEFANSENLQILVATTVIEVGVDIKEASLIVIFNAERFGLAALHQLRGRVGRNDYDDNSCILLTNNYSVNKPRLQFLAQSQNGYEIAEKDLELRGAGDIIGKQQSGFMDEIEQVVGLYPAVYVDMKEIVDNLDWPNLESLPRLKKYLEKNVKEIWQE